LRNFLSLLSINSDYNGFVDFKQIIQKTREIFKLYAESDERRLGHEWPRGEYAKALAADVGALIKLTMAKDGLREVENVDEKLKHEFGDVLSALIYLADKYDVDIEQAFWETMKTLEDRAAKNELAKSHTL